MPPVAASAAIVAHSPSCEPAAPLQPRAPNPTRQAWRTQMLRRRDWSHSASTPPGSPSAAAPAAPRKPQPKCRPVALKRRGGVPQPQAAVHAGAAAARGDGLDGMRHVQGRMWDVVKKEYACLFCCRSPV